MAITNENRIEILDMIHQRTGRILFLENAKSQASKGTLQNTSSEIEFNDKGFGEIWDSLIFKGYKSSVELLNEKIKEEEKLLMNLIRQLKGGK